MISLKTEKKLANLLFTLSECERAVEVSRQFLAKDLSFDVFFMFRFMNFANSGKIDAYELKKYLKLFRVSVKLSVLQMVIFQYDSNKDNQLSFHEFQSMLLPSDNAKLRKQVLERKITFVSNQTRLIVAKHIELEAQTQIRLQNLKNQLFSIQDFSIAKGFQAINHDQSEFIEFIDMKDFLYKHKYDVADTSIDNIIRRIDSDNDRKLNYKEFSLWISPFPSQNPKKINPRPHSAKKAINSASPKKSFSAKKNNHTSKSATKDYFKNVSYFSMKEIIQVFKSQIKLDHELEKEKEKL